MAAATLTEAKRFSVKTDADMNCDTEVSDCNKDPTWRVNFDEFKRLFRKKACVGCAKKTLDDEAGIVLSAFLDATKATTNTVSLSINSLFEEVIKSREGGTMTLELVKAFLVQLGCDSVDRDGSYTLDVAEIIKRAQREEVESIVLKRYGKEAYRLFRLLAENRHPVETSVISGRILVEYEDTKKLLYKMWVENFLHMEFVKRPLQAELFFWSVNRNLNDLILEELFHSALNVRMRVACEKDRERQVKLLNSALAKLDDAIMLFHDF